MAYLTDAQAQKLAEALTSELYKLGRIADIGVGSSTKALADAGLQVLAVDIDGNTLEQVEGYKGVVTLLVDASKMEFGPYKALNMAGLPYFVPEVAEQVVENAVRQELRLVAVSPDTEGIGARLRQAGYVSQNYDLRDGKTLTVYTKQ